MGIWFEYIGDLRGLFSRDIGSDREIPRELLKGRV